MSEKTNHFKIGVFVLIGLGLFVGALFALGLGRFFDKGYLFETYVPGGVENLALGSPVKLRGVAVGKVLDINFIGKIQPEFRQQAVRIVFEVRRSAGVITQGMDNVQQMLDVEIAHGLRARVESQGLIGPGMLSLEYVDPKLYPIMTVPWATNNYYIPSAPSQVEHIFDALETTLSHTEELDLAALVARVQKLADTANRLIENINKIDFNSLGTNAGSLIVELRETNHGLKDALKDAQNTLADAQKAINGADLPAVSRDTRELEARLSNAATELRRVLASVDTGELNSSLANVRSATEELTVLLQTLKQQPSEVLFSKPPKPSSSVEEPPKK